MLPDINSTLQSLLYNGFLTCYIFISGVLDRAGSRMVAFGDRVFLFLKVGRGINPPIASDGHGDMRSKYGVQGQREEMALDDFNNRVLFLTDSIV